MHPSGSTSTLVFVVANILSWHARRWSARAEVYLFSRNVGVSYAAAVWQLTQLLEQLRALAHEAVPRRARRSSGVIRGTILFRVSGHAGHAGVAFTPSTREGFDADLAGLATGKGTVKLPYGQPVPGDLLRRMITFRVRVRVREHEDDGVPWM